MYKVGFFLIISFYLLCSAQAGNGTLKSELDSVSRPTFIEIGTGLRIGNFRDFATSPLFYSGAGFALKLGRVKKNAALETDFNLVFATGNYFTTVEDEIHSSSIRSISLNYSYLKGIEKFQTRKYSFMAGGMLSAMGNYRFNESLMNNNLGLEALINLQASAKVIRDVSRLEKKNKKFLFISYTLEPRVRKLSYQFNVGLVNSSYRNGYAYISQGSITNRDGLNVFDDHQFKIFSGVKVGSCLAYEIYLKNGNRVKLSYDWEVYKTGGDLDALEMSNHFLQIALLFKTN